MKSAGFDARQDRSIRRARLIRSKIDSKGTIRRATDDRGRFECSAGTGSTSLPPFPPASNRSTANPSADPHPRPESGKHVCGGAQAEHATTSTHTHTCAHKHTQAAQGKNRRQRTIGLEFLPPAGAVDRRGRLRLRHLAVGESSVILLHPPLCLVRCFSMDGEGTSVE